ncbi:hypothetical protein L1887_02126 [Cichorium endivia]|nr:hypothetical protein L1887_02126 [Cichorium endivia]
MASPARVGVTGAVLGRSSWGLVGGISACWQLRLDHKGWLDQVKKYATHEIRWSLRLYVQPEEKNEAAGTRCLTPCRLRRRLGVIVSPENKDCEVEHTAGGDGSQHDES